MNNKTIFKWFSMLLLMMVAGISGAAAQSLALDDFSIKAGETKDVTIKLVTESAIYGVQTDISLDGLTLEAVAAVDENLSFASNTVTSGAKRVSLMSMSEGTRVIPAGDIITLTVKAADNFTNGTISLTNTRLTTSTTGAELQAGDVTANVTLDETPVVISSMQLYGTFPGLSWETGVEMTNDESNTAIWTYTMTDVEIEGKTYEYKVSANGKWGEYQIPADDSNQNWTFGTDMYPAGLYDLTFTVNTEEHTLTLDVVKKGEIVPATTATFNFADPNFRENIGENMTDTKGYIYNETFTAEGVSLQITAGSAPSRIYVDNNRGQNLVTYKEYTTLTFRAPEGKAITKIEFTAAGNSSIKNFTASSGAIDEMTWTGNAAGVRFLQGGTSYLANAIVTLEAVDEATAALPAIEYAECANIAAFNALEAGTYAKITLTDAEIIGKSADGYSTVWVQDATGGAWIQYTSLNDRLQEGTKVNGTVFTIKRFTAGNPQLKEAEATINSEIASEAISSYTIVEGTIEEVNVPENLNKVVKISGATLAMTSASAGKLTLGETTIDVNNGTETANQLLHKIADWEKDKVLENVTVTAILVAKSATANQLLPISIEQPVVISSMAIVGDFIGLEGNDNWDPANGWAMTQSAENPAIWTLTKEFEAEAKKYEYKATANGNWTDYVLPAGDNQNFVFGTDEYPAGKYNLTFTANTEEHKLTLDVEAVGTVEPNDYTSYIVNADLTGQGGFDATGTKGIDGSGIVKCANNAQFDFKQTITLPAGQYKLTAKAAYRYSGSEADEYNAIVAGTDTKLATLYATTSTKTESAKVLNRWDGASDTDYANGDGSVTVNEKYVPNSSNAVKAWFNAGQYVNEVVFNHVADGDVTIGIVKTAQPEAGDYTVIGPWTLIRLGDAVDEPVEQEFTATFTTNAGWEKAYAYAWTGEGEEVVKFLGDWPGTEMTPGNGGNDWMISFKAEAAPANIIFSNGLEGDALQQTEDLVFENGKAYDYTITKPQPGIPAGRYYILAMAEEDNNLMAAGHNWGTKGIINGTGLDITLTYNESNDTYDFDTRVSNGANSHFLGSNLYMDSSSWGWSIEEADYGHYIWSTIDGAKKYIGVSATSELELTDTPYAWAFMDADWWENNLLEGLKDATATAPVDATFLIKCADFNRNDQRKSAWTMTASNQNLNGGCNETHWNTCAESYHSVFTLSQALGEVPAGVYSMTAQGFYRQDGADNDNLPYFYANDEKQTFPLRTGTENGMDTAGDSFLAGKYTVDPIYVQVAENGTLTVGAKLENNTTLWCIWDNFQLKYYGTDADIDQLKNAALIAEMEELKAKAEDLATTAEFEAAKTALESAIAKANAAQGTEAIKEAINALKDAINTAETFAKAKDVLAKMKQVVESTNVYTAEACEEYYGQWQAKYDAGTLTIEEANALEDPFAIRGWHAQNTVDDFLLSAWPEANKTYADPWEQTLYINTWSTEGADDGTNFVVPFFEYWTGDANSLGEKTWTATMTNVPEGEYEISAWVRVRGKNNFTLPAYGITMQANDGEAVSVIGDRVSEQSNFYLKNVTAIGTVAGDGVLNITFNIAADNNISWLSFMNVNYSVKEPEPIVFPEGATVYDFAAAAAAGENPGNKNGSAANGQAFYGWENPEKTDSKRQDYKGYEWAEGSVLPEECHVWRRSDRINGNVADGGLKCPSNKEMAIDGLKAGDKVIIVYDATGAAEDSKNIIWAIGDGTAEGGPGTVRATATIDGVEAVSGTTTIASGAEIVVNSVTPAENGTGYIVFQVKKGMIIKQIAVVQDSTTTGIASANAAAEQNAAGIYNLNGQKVKNARKGLYIVNGKKQVVK